jgi:hypothetical protein
MNTTASQCMHTRTNDHSGSVNAVSGVHGLRNDPMLMLLIALAGVPKGFCHAASYVARRSHGSCGSNLGCRVVTN